MLRYGMVVGDVCVFVCVHACWSAMLWHGCHI